MLKDKAIAVALKAVCAISGHNWQGCKCSRCGDFRDEGHEFIQTESKCEMKCTICEKTEALPHQWIGKKCSRCGAVRGFADRVSTTVGNRLPFMHLEKKNNRTLLGIGTILVLCFLFLGIMTVSRGSSENGSISMPTTTSELTTPPPFPSPSAFPSPAPTPSPSPSASPSPTQTPSPSPSLSPEPPAPATTYVWIPNSGSKYHSRPSCSNMINPTEVTREEAISRGFTKCSRCW